MSLQVEAPDGVLSDRPRFSAPPRRRQLEAKDVWEVGSSFLLNRYLRNKPMTGQAMVI
ncbi:hypothetical protein FPSE_09198 [Fusarium pseudograminearum CS3096]|uniref:Uncharacterized protein n=1 Tax=Fusarium pseudograminearum (strain CS3096) TaxID=1028729 RepID=K3VDQ6_FUSPC|nr:hypothetical protein FPSE_09198 [Fusarium pseudograminearum CS3096]EKJ70688.1 hypothetical protein FPSE_09198 [Fusarium pseudograminearum CS3096]